MELGIDDDDDMMHPFQVRGAAHGRSLLRSRLFGRTCRGGLGYTKEVLCDSSIGMRRIAAQGQRGSFPNSFQNGFGLPEVISRSRGPLGVVWEEGQRVQSSIWIS